MIRLVKTEPRGFYFRGTVQCPNCSEDIHLVHVDELPVIFLARCDSCGREDIFARKDIHVHMARERRATLEVTTIV